jgi:acyl dehydratase
VTVHVDIAELPGLQGQVIGPSPAVEMTQERINAFAACTLDEQWIHVDVDRAEQGPYGTTIAHGFLTLAMLSHFMEELLVVDDAQLAINYGLDRVRFPAALMSGSLLRASVEVRSVLPADQYTTMTARMTFSADDSERPCCVADSVTRFVKRVQEPLA